MPDKQRPGSAADDLMPAPNGLQHLKACGATGRDITLYERLIANETFQRASATAVFDQLSDTLVDIPSDAYNRMTMHAKVRYPEGPRAAPFHQKLANSIDIEESARRPAYARLAASIKQFTNNTSEIAARALYKAVDLDFLLSPFHAVEDTHTDGFFECLRRNDVDSATFHIFALFVCFTSDKPHIVQTMLFALSATSGAVPYPLLDVLGRYEIYNLPCYALIERVPGLTNAQQDTLLLTHLKSMDEAFYSGKLNILKTTQHQPMIQWAALNTSSLATTEYFCDTLMEQPVRDDHLLAALDHLLWCMSSADAEADAPGALLQDYENQLFVYLCARFNGVSASVDSCLVVRQRYAALARLNERYRSQNTSPDRSAEIEGLLDVMTATFAQPRFDQTVAAHAPDLADQSAGYLSLLRPPGHRYDLFVHVKIAASERWFNNELERVRTGDFANWGTLSLLLQTGKQFNALSAWLLREMAQAKLPRPLIEALVKDALLHYPAQSDLLLQANQFFARVLKSQHTKWIQRAIYALHKHKSNGHAVPRGLITALQALDVEKLPQLHRHLLKKLI